MTTGAVLIHPDDNVATAVRRLEKGEIIVLRAASREIRVALSQEIPPGHKFALREIPKGGDVIKYGEIIGLATADIAAGEHVHVHNVAGRRGRGDIL